MSELPAMPPLETHPTEGQQLRLESLLHEIARACRRSAIRLMERDGEMHLVDMISGTLIGVGLVTFEDDNGHIRAIECDGSILDGVWLVEDSGGEMIEQREMPVNRWRKPQ